MELKEKIKSLADKVLQQKDNISTEEATKNAFIMPFIAALGYDVFNPIEVIPELDCDISKKKGEKIDYAIMKDGLPILLIECKHWQQNLSLHNTQLKRYYVASKAKFGLLTNGIRYLFYTDLEQTNIMDEKPFLDIDITDIKDYQIEELKKFQKDAFDIDNILSSANELKYTQQIKNVFANEIINPSPEIVKFFAKKVYEGACTAKVQDMFAGLVRRAINSYISDSISNRLKSALENESMDNAPISEETDDTPLIVTTEEELEGYAIVKAIVRKVIDIERVFCRDTQSYFGILLDDNNRKPICRLLFNGKSKKYIVTFDAERKEVKHEITSLNDIYNFEKEICEAAKMYD